MDMNLISKYAPYLYFDKNEPFFPVRIGCTICEQSQSSPSFRREILFYDKAIKYVIEYAIYWDFDIQHLYELEHVWIYVDKHGKVFDCEASFHGKYLKGLLKDKSNLEDGTHVKLYSQPGKHAFSPFVQLFDVIPNFERVCYEDAGAEGLCITSVAKGRYSSNEEENILIEKYLKQYQFKPAMEYEKYVIPNELFVPWQVLDDEIPQRINKKLAEIRQKTK